MEHKAEAGARRPPAAGEGGGAQIRAVCGNCKVKRTRALLQVLWRKETSEAGEAGREWLPRHSGWGTMTARELAPLHTQVGNQHGQEEKVKKKAKNRQTNSQVSGKLIGSRSSAECRRDTWTAGQMDTWADGHMDR